MRLSFSKFDTIRDQLITLAMLIMAVLLIVARNEDAFQNTRKFSVSLVNFIEAPLSNVRVYRSALQTNTELEKRLILLQDELSRLRSVREENRSLREMLELERTSEYDMQAVRIVVKNLTGINNNLTINAGREQGVKVGMPVVNHQGLIGTVVLTGQNNSKVLPLYSIPFRASVSAEGSRAYGILSWESRNMNELVMRFVPQTVLVEDGTRIYTSGLSNQFPAGIPVGEVLYSVQEPGRETQLIYIRPFVEFSTLAEAHVMLYEAEEEVLELEQSWQEMFK
jgi:rod shape-determining protein MreC